MRSRFAFLFSFCTLAASSTALTLVAAACSSSKESPASLPLIEGGSGGRRDSGDPPIDEQDAEVADTYIPPGTPGRVYAHTADTLYLFEPVTNDLKMIGKFTCLNGSEQIIDLAVDRTGSVYATSFTRFLKVDPITAACTEIKANAVGDDDYPNALSFVPAGTVESDREALVGFQGGDYVKIDVSNGMVTKIGAIGDGLVSSGDVVSAKGGKTYVTVKGKGCADCLVEIDPATGKSTKNWGSIGKPDVFGLAFWAGDLYAFTNAGELLLLTLDSGSLVATAVPITNAPAKFWGAGSTTSAPVGPVR